MSKPLLILLIILVVLLIALIVLYFVGRRLQRKQAATQEQMEAAKQSITMLVIDKKMMRIKDSGLPQMVIDQTPKLMRRQKLPIVKAKVGPRIMTMVADSKIYDLIPIKKEIRAIVSGIYIMDVKGIRGSLEQVQKKKGLFARAKEKAASLTGRGGTAESSSASGKSAGNKSAGNKSAAAKASAANNSGNGKKSKKKK